ncbi:MAG: hypothetical protein JNK72_18170 [Myxococcales bacterium]|nr:hypothetical protein [Myxococcales bacterium]
MGKGDRRHSQKMIQRKGQKKLKSRLRKAREERLARHAAAGQAAEKKTARPRRPSSAS